MKVSESTITAFGKTLAGDDERAPYMSGPKLVDFFNEFGSNDSYSWGGGFPTRRVYAADKFREINGTDKLRLAILAMLDPRRFIGTSHNVADTVGYLNQYLKHDKYEIVPRTDGWAVKEAGKPLVDFSLPYKASTPETHAFIDQQVEKCERKLAESDFDGAITNARSFVESVLTDLERKLDPSPSSYDGDLPKLFKRVRKLMNLDEAQYKELDAVLQLLRGLTSTIDGLSGMSNKMGDRHVITQQPKKHHAALAVNAAKTLGDFMVSSYVHQQGRGSIPVRDA